MKGLARAIEQYSFTYQEQNKMKEILIYGVSKEYNEQYHEDLLSTNCKTKADIEKVLQHAKEHGYHSFRVVNFELSKPDFTKIFAE